MSILGERPNILIVDDETNIRLMLRTALSFEYEVDEASDGKTGLEAIERRKPDLVILDLSMPALDGIGVLKALSAYRPSRKPRVIVLTAYGSIPMAVKAIRLGASDFLEKPVSPDELREAIASALAEPEPVPANEAEPLGLPPGGYEGVLEHVRKSLRLTHYADAETLLMKAADLSHRDAAYFNLLGVLYEARREARVARRFYERALKTDRHYEPAVKNLRRLHEITRYGHSREALALGDEPDLWYARMPEGHEAAQHRRHSV